MAFTGWLAGQRLTTQRLDLISSIPTSYNVVWTSTSGAAPSLGNGSLEGRYAMQGGLCHVWVSLKGGSTTTWGGGQHAFSLPVNAASRAIDTAMYAGSAIGLDSGANYYPGVSRIFQAGTVIMPISPTTSTGATPTEWNATRPFAWGTGDSMNLYCVYEYV
ncbi:hypothetical protein LG634_24580 [Streptomyces bambusae]|uniref:hypothetical protein n=1 Tax=Streptomyces bambusae TaxID=1550616 RepID=UPI001CFED08A|nr:hypothetical protein [Streptomyces bambusae]MCB5167990.1 hypothetical protein [Streptomyces bambusae]